MSLDEDMVEYHGLVSQSVAVLDKDLGVLEDKAEAIRQENERLKKEIGELKERENNRSIQLRISVAASIIALLVSLTSLFL